MKNKVTMDDLNALWKEIERGQKDKSRILKDVDNSKVKNILTSGVETAIKTGVKASMVAGTAGAAVGTASAIGGTTAFTAGGVALGAAGTGAVAGSAVPIVGTVIGAGAGLVVGLFVGTGIKKKNDREKRRLFQEVISKQNTIIKDLKNEVEELRKKCGEYAWENERYRYIISLLMANNDLKKML